MLVSARNAGTRARNSAAAAGNPLYAGHQGRDPIDFVDAMGEQLANVHVCDWDENGRLCLPGEGTFDFTAFIRALRRANYAGAVIVEPYLALVKSDEALEKSIRTLKRIAGEQNKSMD